MSGGAIALVLLSALLHAGWNAVAKGSRDPIAFNLLMSLAPVLAGPALLPFFRLADVPPAVWWLTAATGVAHALYFLWLGMAYQRGDLSLVYPISRSTPAFVTLAAVALLGEPVSLRGALGIAVVVAGMWLVQTDGGIRWRALMDPRAIYAYFTLAATVVYSLVDKRAMQLLSAGDWDGPAPRAVVFYFLLCTSSALVFVPFAVRRLRPGAFAAVAGSELGRVLGSAVVSFASYALILEALRTAPVSYVAAVRQTSVLFAVALGVVWLRERPGWLRIVGALATVAGVALISAG